MKIEDRKFVALDYTLSLDSGEVVDRSTEGEPLGFIFGAGQIIQGLEQELEGMEPGQKARLTVEADQGYGEPREELYRELPRENFPDDLTIEPGMGFEAKGPHGPVQFRVKSVGEDAVVADFNHPLAGERLHFDVEVVEVREPEAEELSRLMEEECSPSDCGGCSGSCG